MVVRIQLTVKHIKGHTFPIEADVDSEVLGLKLQIWESQKIPIENQRLVFSGKELADNVILSQMNIGDGATIFLVESMSEVPPQPQSEIPQVTIQVPAQVVPMVDGNANITQQQCVNSCQPQYPIATNAVPINVNYYEPVEVETALSEERIQSVIDLACWVRLYCILGFVVSIICCFENLYSLIPLVMFLCGYFGARKVNRCLLVCPLILTAFLGFGYTIASLYYCFKHFNGLYIGTLFFGLMHVVIFLCICKLMTRIRKLSCQEWVQTRTRMCARRRRFFFKKTNERTT